MCLPFFVGGKFHLRQISFSAGPVGLACFLFASHFVVSLSSEGDDSIAFLGLRRMRGVAGGVAVGGVAAGGGSERINKKLETFDGM